MNNLQPLTPTELDLIAKSKNKLKFDNYEAFFKKQIKEASNYAIGPYYWFIGDNANMLITTASKNIGELTPFSQKEWENKSPLFFAENIHPEDSFYVLSAFQLATEKIIQLPAERQPNVRVNIYARMLNANKVYRWVLIQLPALYINKKGNEVTTCGLIMVTDLSHLSFTERPVLMTLSDKVNNQNEYYHIASDNKKLVGATLPNITKREQEILQLMARGLNSPEIAKHLFLSYHTVEKHKKNLRVKTGSRTSAELMNFVCTNNMF